MTRAPVTWYFDLRLLRTFSWLSFIFVSTLLISRTNGAQLRYVQQRTASGVLEGVVSADGKVRTFKGIPYATPPVGPLRWKPPQPITPWKGVRKAVDYGPRCMQTDVFSDMVFRDEGPSEDCLYLNLWMPEVHSKARLPVMVWIYGGRYNLRRISGFFFGERADGFTLGQRTLCTGYWRERRVI
jgi:para-nitrobenzyl esterase